MCGFTAIINRPTQTVSADTLARMTHSLEHRGPDQQGFHLDGPVGFGFRRLSILDLSDAGRQPMHSDDGNLVIVFNGEIFNYIELRDELQRLGHRFHSSGDTEVLLHAWQQWGHDCLPRLNGMWSFLIHDRRTQRIVGARDRFGIKPLYLYRTDGTTLFGSEIKALLVAPQCQPRTDWVRAADFLIDGRLDDTAHSFFEGIRQIPAGHRFELTLQGRLSLHAYWSLDDIAPDEPAGRDTAAEFAELFEDSVRLRLRSDVPVGVCLSGGLDSTAIICAMARQRAAMPATTTDALHAFSFNPAQFDESRYLNDTLRQTGANLHSLQCDPQQIWSTLSDVLTQHDEPVHSMTALVGYRLMALAASRGVKVVLNGQGADETLGGYPNYHRLAWHGLLRQARLRETLVDINDYANRHGVERTALIAATVTRTLSAALGRYSAYRALAAWRHRADNGRRAWFSGELIDRPAQPRRAVIRNTGHSPLRAGLSASVDTSPLPLYLRIEDRNSMAHSIEARLPFMDYRLVTMAFRLADHWKLQGAWNKVILRQAMRQRIPESVRTRVDKMGFPTPASAWIRETLHQPIDDILADRQTRERGIYDIHRIRHDLQRHRRGEIDIAARLFDVVQFELWSRLKIDPHQSRAGSATAGWDKRDDLRLVAA